MNAVNKIDAYSKHYDRTEPLSKKWKLVKGIALTSMVFKKLFNEKRKKAEKKDEPLTLRM